MARLRAGRPAAGHGRAGARLGMRAALSAAACAAAVLQYELPPGGTDVAMLEVPGAVPGHSGRQGEVDRQRRRYRERVRNRKQVEKDVVPELARIITVLMPAATSLAARKDYSGSRARRCRPPPLLARRHAAASPPLGKPGDPLTTCGPVAKKLEEDFTRWANCGWVAPGLRSTGEVAGERHIAPNKDRFDSPP